MKEIEANFIRNKRSSVELIARSSIVFKHCFTDFIIAYNIATFRK